MYVHTGRLVELRKGSHYFISLCNNDMENVHCVGLVIPASDGKN